MSSNCVSTIGRGFREQFGSVQDQLRGSAVATWKVIKQQHCTHEVFSKITLLETSKTILFQRLKMPGKLQHLTITPLGDTFVAQVDGLDFSQPIPDEVADELRAALHVHGVLVARATSVTDETMIALGRKWGPLDNITAHKKAGRKMRLDNDEIFDVSNIDPDNNIISPADPLRISSQRGNSLFHADGAYNPRRSGISIIRAVELPPKGTGGETEFLDSRTAYEDLPEEKKEEIKNYVGMNTLLWNRIQANPEGTPAHQ